MKLFSAFTAIFALSLAGVPATAAVQYEFVLTSDVFEGTGGFTFTRPDFITTTTLIPLSDFQSCTIAYPGWPSSCGNITFFVVDPSNFPPSGRNILVIDTFDDRANYTGQFEFVPGAFFQPGSYASSPFDSNRGNLTITRLMPPPGGVVPEPASWAMLIAGFGLVGASLRRRRGEATVSG